MARIRTIKPAFFRHEGLYELERDTGLPVRVAFAGLWTAADREGRFVWSPRQLKLDCLPYDDVDFSRVLDALSTRGLIVKYASQGVDYGCIPSWNKHQIVNNRETQSEIPAPPENPAIATDATREARVDDASATPLCNYQGEGKGREQEGKEIPVADAPVPTGGKKSAKAQSVTLKTWLANLPDDAPVISPDDPIFTWAQKTGVPEDFMALSWEAFVDRYLSKPKKYKDWRAVWRTAVQDNWLKLWYIDRDGSYALTTVGVQARRAAA